jgi:hypothetical protein
VTDDDRALAVQLTRQQAEELDLDGRERVFVRPTELLTFS